MLGGISIIVGDKNKPVNSRQTYTSIIVSQILLHVRFTLKPSPGCMLKILTTIILLLFSLALQPSAGYGFLVHEVS
jgi:hypothetical protein